MSISDINAIKNDLAKWVLSMKNEDLIHLLSGIKNSNEVESDWWDNLSENEKSEIKVGLEDVKKGNTISSDDFWKKLE